MYFQQQMNNGWTMPNRPQPRNTQPITQEMSKLIFSQEDDLSVKISPVEKLKNQCTHKYPGTGNIALVNGADGKVTCRVCGESFNLIMDPTAEIATTTEKMRDILQSIKTMYLDIPENFVKEYFQVITLLERAPALFDKASKNFGMYDQYSTNPMGVYSGVNSFQQVNSMIGMNMGGIMPQPGFGYMPQQPMYQQAPMQGQPQQAAPQQTWPVNAYGQPVPPAPQGMYDMSGNPFMYGAPVQQAPQNPATAAPAPAPGVAPAQPGEVTQTKAFNV